MTATKDMSLRQYLSTMSFQPKHAEAIEKLFRLTKDWRSIAAYGADGCCHGDCADNLDEILGEP